MHGTILNLNVKELMGAGTPFRFSNGESAREVGLVGLALVGSLLAGCYTSISDGNMKSYSPHGAWIVSATEAVDLANTALFLDARASGKTFVADSVRVSWQQFSRQQAPWRGQLLPDLAELQTRIQAVGVRSEQTVVVIGDPVGGWGEDGRIVWMLRALGHANAKLVDGGMPALKKAGMPLGKTRSPAPGTFSVQVDPSLSVTREAVRQHLEAAAVSPGSVLFVDTREPGEYAGDTPYGEVRGGHLPGAVHLHYEALLDTLGRLKSEAELMRLLTEAGIEKNKDIIAYCTGGVRSGWFVAVLADLGFPRVANYAGSMWEWSAGDETAYPLER